MKRTFLLLLLSCFLQVPLMAQEKTEYICHEPYKEFDLFSGRYNNANISLNGAVMSVKQISMLPAVQRHDISKGKRAYARQQTWLFMNTGQLIRCHINKIYLKDFQEYDSIPSSLFEITYDSTEFVTLYDFGGLGRIRGVINPYGNEIYYNYDENGDLTNVFTYYGKANVMSEKAIYLNENGKPVRVEDNTYRDKRMHRVCPSDFGPRGKKKVDFVDTYWYDERGNKVAHQMNNGKIVTKMWKYVYDSLNNMILEGSCNGYNGNNKTCKCKDFSAHEGYEYDDRHRLIRDYSIGEWQPEGMDNYYQYDSAGRVIDYRHYTVRGTQRRFKDHIQTTYDSTGRMVKREALLGEFPINESIFNFTMAVLEECAYDEHGNLVEHVVYQTKIKPFKIVRYQYTYDQHGNWVKRIRYEGVSRDSNTVTEILERRIEYYE